jgi:flagellar hook-basal body complex protein FliE
MKTLPLTQVNLKPVMPAAKPDVELATQGFSDVLKKSLNSVNEATAIANEMQEGLVTGAHSNIHETMIAIEKANISFRLLTKVQQKAISAYQEIMRMQV